MRVKVIDIGVADAFHYDKDRFIGKIGTFATYTTYKDGYVRGTMHFDSLENLYSPNTYPFYRIKLEPISDENE